VGPLHSLFHFFQEALGAVDCGSAENNADSGVRLVELGHKPGFLVGCPSHEKDKDVLRPMGTTEHAFSHNKKRGAESENEGIKKK